MRALRLGETSPLPATLESVARPVPGRGEILVRVHAAGVTPTEVAWWPTTHTKEGRTRSGAVPGHEFSGVVAEVGDGASGVEVGDAVYGMNDWFADGATAEYCVTRPEWVAGKPIQLTHAEAASVPIGALTAWQGLLDRAKIKSGDRILIHGGSGAVGVYAVQLARRAGAHVITTASARNREFLTQLGAAEVIDYHTARFEESVGKVDVVFDTVGGETLRRSWDVLTPGGRMVTVAADVEGTADERAKGAFFIVEAKRKQLEEIARLLDAGEIRPVVDAVVPLERAGEAYAGKVTEKLGRGKVVVAVAGD